MYVILTSKPDLYTSALEGGAFIVEAYKYLFYGRCKATFEIVKLGQETKVIITETDPPYVTNRISTKFLEHFDTIELARAELSHLTRFGGLQASLELCNASEAQA